MGFGTNELGTWPSLREASERIIVNLGQMIDAIESHDAQPILFSVPHANESVFPPAIALDAHRRRDYHNPRLAQFCQQQDLPLAEISSHLRDEHFGDELHPNENGARIIASEVFTVPGGLQRARSAPSISVIAKGDSYFQVDPKLNAPA